VPLFVRGARRLALTDAGRTLLVAALYGSEETQFSVLTHRDLVLEPKVRGAAARLLGVRW
jgi:DNA-binding transcriptional LysR family regulator